MRLPLFLCAAVALASPALARDSLGMFGQWGAFRDAAVPRCFAIAKPQPGKGHAPLSAYADVASWPKKGVRGQVHFRLSHPTAAGAPITLSMGGQRWALVGGGGEAWAADERMDAAIVAAMRSASDMSVSARDSSGHGFSDDYELQGAATAMDAAALGCANH